MNKQTNKDESLQRTVVETPHICLCGLCHKQPLTGDNPVIPRGGGAWPEAAHSHFRGKGREL